MGGVAVGSVAGKRRALLSFKRPSLTPAKTHCALRELFLTNSLRPLEGQHFTAMQFVGIDEYCNLAVCMISRDRIKVVDDNKDDKRFPLKMQVHGGVSWNS